MKTKPVGWRKEPKKHSDAARKGWRSKDKSKKSPISYTQYLRNNVYSYDKRSDWEKAHIRQANKIDYNLYCLREAGVIKDNDEKGTLL